MADPQLATRAPENDAAEDVPKQTPAAAATESLFLGDTSAQTGASLGVITNPEVLGIIAELLL